MKNILKISHLSISVLPALLLFTSFLISAKASAGGHCSGEAAGCETIPIGKCTENPGCSAQPDQTCVGLPLACTYVIEKDKCLKQAGCNWSN